MDVERSLIDATLGAYTVTRLIGRGGMGIVYEAVHAQLGRRVALKLLHPRYADRPDALTRFKREGRAAAHLRHPHVVTVFDVGDHDGAAFLVMDLVEGATLAQRLAERGPLGVREIVDVFLPVLAAVAAAHEAGVIHRDLKPANIVFDTHRYLQPWPMVLDFGIAKLVEEEDPVTRSEAIVGTLPYLPPEQAKNPRAASPAGDQYALGVMLYECATGRRPFEGVSAYELLHAIVTSTPSAPSRIDPRIPADLDALIAKAMSRDPAARFPSARALASALLSFGSRRAWEVWGPDLVASAEAPPGDVTIPELTAPRLAKSGDVTTAPARWKRHRYIAPAALVAGLALGTTVGGALAQSSRGPRDPVDTAALRAVPLVTTPAITTPTITTPTVTAPIVLDSPARDAVPSVAETVAPVFADVPPRLSPVFERTAASPTWPVRDSTASASRPPSSAPTTSAPPSTPRSRDRETVAPVSPTSTPVATTATPAASDYGTRHVPIVD